METAPLQPLAPMWRASDEERQPVVLSLRPRRWYARSSTWILVGGGTALVAVAVLVIYAIASFAPPPPPAAPSPPLAPPPLRPPYNPLPDTARGPVDFNPSELTLAPGECGHALASLTDPIIVPTVSNRTLTLEFSGELDLTFTPAVLLWDDSNPNEFLDKLEVEVCATAVAAAGRYTRFLTLDSESELYRGFLPGFDIVVSGTPSGTSACDCASGSGWCGNTACAPCCSTSCATSERERYEASCPTFPMPNASACACGEGEGWCSTEHCAPCCSASCETSDYELFGHQCSSPLPPAAPPSPPGM